METFTLISPAYVGGNFTRPFDDQYQFVKQS